MDIPKGTPNTYKIFYQVIGLFIGLNMLFIYLELYYLIAIPLAIAMITIAFFRLDWLLYIIVFTVPFSITIENLGGGMGLTLPTDPLLFGSVLLFTLNTLYNGRYDVKIITHPITLSIIATGVWVLISTLFSELYIISIKSIISRLWFIIPFFFVCVRLFRTPKHIIKMTWMYIIPMTGVVIYTLSRQYVRGFDIKSAHWVMQPFFNDHTAYAAMMAFFIPMIIMQIRTIKSGNYTQIFKILCLIILTIGILFSYTRAAWMSLFAAGLVWIILQFKIKWWVVGLPITIITFGISVLWVPIQQKLQKNEQDSSETFAKHIESMSNVMTDDSNLERINRWTAAIKMFTSHPIVGTGVGTYSFLYAPYQTSQQMTKISTNFGDRGNAHSEYLGRLAEQGFMGLTLWIILIFFCFYRGVYTLKHVIDPVNKALMMGLLLGLTTYLSHGLLNNFLDSDKGAVPFWAFIAAIVAIDLYAEKTNQNGERNSIGIEKRR